jgi:hypothetical protein
MWIGCLNSQPILARRCDLVSRNFKMEKGLLCTQIHFANLCEK